MTAQGRSAKRRCEHCGVPDKCGRSGLCKECRYAAFVEDLEFLIKVGVGWGQIIDRFGISPEAIERRCQRAERWDVAALWRGQVADEGSWRMAGWVALEKQHTSRIARPKDPEVSNAA